jgi:hypothetical protein
MKLVVDKQQFKYNPVQFLRRAGYSYQESRTGQASFVRRLSSLPYPRFHLYVQEDEDKIIFNLHLDQKQPSYAGAHSHNAEYEGELVEAEINRLRQMITNSQI